MPSVGWPELVVLLVLALLLFGPQKLAGIGGAVGKTIRDFRQALHGSEKEEAQPPDAPPKS